MEHEEYKFFVRTLLNEHGCYGIGDGFYWLSAINEKNQNGFLLFSFNGIVEWQRGGYNERRRLCEISAITNINYSRTYCKLTIGADGNEYTFELK